uniref:Uncharacterized protein n=1 Tax=Coccidioides posadasii RMSCC 3488 TaxID=454284 RepID=A0A0J6IF21_COCPO|nr:hypothetical protein CPAG_06694 [Coccidioides posadasii RMSCC 3488]
MSGKTASLGHSEFRRDAPVVMTGSKAKESASKFPNNDPYSVRFDRPGLDRGPLGTFMMGSRCSSSPRSSTPTGEKPCGFRANDGVRYQSRDPEHGKIPWKTRAKRRKKQRNPIHNPLESGCEPQCAVVSAKSA